MKNKFKFSFSIFTGFLSAFIRVHPRLIVLFGFLVDDFRWKFVRGFKD